MPVSPARRLFSVRSGRSLDRPGAWPQDWRLPSSVAGVVASPARPRRGVCSDVQAGRLRTTLPRTPVAGGQVFSPDRRRGCGSSDPAPCSTWARVFRPGQVEQDRATAPRREREGWAFPAPRLDAPKTAAMAYRPLAARIARLSPVSNLAGPLSLLAVLRSTDRHVSNAAAGTPTPPVRSGRGLRGLCERRPQPRPVTPASGHARISGLGMTGGVSSDNPHASRFVPPMAGFPANCPCETGRVRALGATDGSVDGT